MTDDDKALVKLLREMQENWKAAYLSMASHMFGRAADRIEAQAAEIERLREALKHQGGPLCMVRYHPTAECTCGVSEALAGKAEQ